MFKKITTPIILLTIGASLAPVVWADDFTIDTAETTTNGGNTLDGDDSITVTEDGTIAGSGTTIGINTTGNENIVINYGEVSSGSEAAIIVTGDENTIVNYGSSEGEDAGIEAIGDNNTLTNNGEVSGLFTSFNVSGDENSVTNAGEIEMNNQFSDGIYVEGESNTVLNSGSILISNDEGETGITVSGDSNSVTNSGTITTYGAGGNGPLAYGIATDGSNNVIANSGTITTNGSDAAGISATDLTNNTYQNTVTNSGTITTIGDDADGIYAYGDGNTITNTGSINVGGENADGIGTGGSSNTVTNSGNITTTGERGYGITSNENNTIINSGNITTSGVRGYGITTYGETNIENSGNISTTGENAYGIYADGDSSTSTNNSTIVNSSNISTTGDFAYGFYSYGSSNSLTNNGTIYTTGADAYGLTSLGDSNVITNNGSIHTTGADSDGLYSQGDSNVITNSGTIKSENGYSIYVNGTDSTINLESGSVLVGDIYFSSTDTTLNIDASTSTFIQFDGVTPADINVASGTYIVSDSSVYIADLSDYTAQDQALTTSTRLLHDAVSNRQANKDDTWFNITGALLNNDGDNTFTGYEGELLSATIGRDKVESTSFFAGLSVTQLESDNAFETSTLTLHGGLYGKWNNEDVAIATGLSYTDVTHQQLDNTTSTGTSETTSDYLSVFISPSLTYSALLSDNDSLRLRYTLAYYNAHDYDFGDSELSVDGRLTNNIEARMAWLHNINLDMLTNDISLRYGADLGYTHGGTVDLTLNGNSKSASTPGDETYARAFLSTSYNSGQLDIAYTSNSEFSLAYTHQF